MLAGSREVDDAARTVAKSAAGANARAHLPDRRAAANRAIVTAMRRYFSVRHNYVLQAFVLLAVVARLLVPQGYMVAGGSDAWVKVVLCSAHGLIQVYVDRNTYEITDKPSTPAKKGDTQEPPCAFLALAQVALPASSASLTYQPLLNPAPSIAYVAEHAIERSTSPPPSTGPPSRLA